MANGILLEVLGRLNNLDLHNIYFVTKKNESYYLIARDKNNFWNAIYCGDNQTELIDAVIRRYNDLFNKIEKGELS